MKHARVIPALAIAFFSGSAAAQDPPAPADVVEDLEVPSTTDPPSETPPVSPPEKRTTSPEPVPAVAPEPALAAPATQTTPAPTRIDGANPKLKSLAAGDSLHINLERKAHTRPVPSGLVIGGYVQGQFQHNAISEDQLQQGGVPLNLNEFVVRRARLRVDRGWDFASATLELDANTVAGAEVGIRRAEASLFYRGPNGSDLPPLVMLSVGVTDLPFGFELADSARVRLFMERSLGSLALFPTEMDAAAKVSGAYDYLRYAVAVGNGQPVDGHGFPHDPNVAKDVVGRFGAELGLSKHAEVAGGTSFAVGRGFHPGNQASKDTAVWRDDNEDGVIDQGELVAFAGRGATPSVSFDRWAIGIDLGGTVQTGLGKSRLYGEAFVASNYDRGFLPSDPVVTGIPVRQAGAYVALTQELGAHLAVGFRASLYDPNSDVIEVRADKALPKTQTVTTFSPVAGFVLPERARLLFQYDFVRDHLARDAVGVPTDADNDQWTARLQVDL